MTFKRRDLLILGFLSFLILVAFGRALMHGYVNWDDDVIIVSNQIIRMPFWEFLKAAFTHFFYSDYLPVTLITFWADYHLLGNTNPYFHHGINLVIHIVNTGLIYFILRYYFSSRIWVYLLSLVFAIHPIQAESVMWASSRNGLLCALFALLSWRYHLKVRKTSKAVGPEVLFYVLSFLCKSMALFLPFFFVTIDLFIEEKKLRDVLSRNFATLTLSIIGITIRIVAYGTGVTGLTSVAFNPARIITLPLVVLKALFLYWSHVIAPFGLSIIYPRYELTLTTLFEVAVVVTFIAIAVFLWRRFKEREYIFFAAMILFFLSPILQVVPRINFINDRYLYFPVLGFTGLSIAIGRDLLRLRRKPAVSRRLIRVGIVILTLVLCVVSFVRGRVWSSNLALWSDTVEKFPSSSIAHNNLGMAEEREGRIDEAVNDYQKSLDLGKSDGTSNLAYNNLAIIYSRKDLPAFFNIKKAINLFEMGIKAAEKKDDTYTLRYNLAMAYLDRGDPNGSLRILKNLSNDLATADPRYLDLLLRTQDKMSQIQSSSNH